MAPSKLVLHSTHLCTVQVLMKSRVLLLGAGFVAGQTLDILVQGGGKLLLVSCKSISSGTTIANFLQLAELSKALRSSEASSLRPQSLSMLQTKRHSMLQLQCTASSYPWFRIIFMRLSLSLRSETRRMSSQPITFRQQWWRWMNNAKTQELQSSMRLDLILE